ncbi:MAG: hypothetical protein Q8K75_09015 [Chlamydiales bacterium]|nr:hypothetical protein [Chlamydiales bacterium]
MDTSIDINDFVMVSNDADYVATPVASKPTASTSYLGRVWNSLPSVSLFSLWGSSQPVARPSEHKPLPFDKGIFVTDDVTTTKISKRILMQDKATIQEIGQYTGARTVDVDGVRVRWSDILAGDIERMVGNGQLKIGDEVLQCDESMTKDQLAEEVVRKIYRLVGDEETTYRITGLMCQSTPNFLFHSARLHILDKYDMEPLYSGESMKTSYHLRSGTGADKRVFLTTKLKGTYDQGIVGVNYPENGVEMLDKPATIKSRADINFSDWNAHIAYTTKLTPSAREFFKV